jgi:hypothetical protein
VVIIIGRFLFDQSFWLRLINVPDPSTTKSCGMHPYANLINSSSSTIFYQENNCRNNKTVYIQGNVKFVTDNRDVAMYSFDAIGIYNFDGTFVNRGGAVFDDGAPGELSSLSNTVAIYKDRIDSSRNGTFLMWH